MESFAVRDCVELGTVSAVGCLSCGRQPTAEFYSWTEWKKLRDTSNRPFVLVPGAGTGEAIVDETPPRPMARNLQRLKAGARP